MIGMSSQGEIPMWIGDILDVPQVKNAPHQTKVFWCFLFTILFVRPSVLKVCFGWCFICPPALSQQYISGQLIYNDLSRGYPKWWYSRIPPKGTKFRAMIYSALPRYFSFLPSSGQFIASKPPVGQPPKSWLSKGILAKCTQKCRLIY